MDGARERKARGAFFTPPDVCRYLVEWAVRTPTDAVLEPSCGEAAVLLAADARLTELAARSVPARTPLCTPAEAPELPRGELHGVDLHAGSVRTARQALAGSPHRVLLRTADFFTIPAVPRFDAVVGNPPFVRYQDFTGPARAGGRAAALAAGVRLSGLASSWAAFTVHSALFLRPGGRLALVLPAELLSVNYAAEVRRFLLRRFGRVRLVLFAGRIFPGVAAEVLLLLAEGQGGTDHCEVRQVDGVGDLLGPAPGAGSRRRVPDPEEDSRWTGALLPDAAGALYRSLTAGPGFGPLQAWGETSLGMVTGDNGFFAVSPQRAADAGLDPAHDLITLSPPGSRHLRGLTLDAARWQALGDEGRATWLFRPAGEPSAAGRAYLVTGERLGVPTAYKCRVRTPWWRVPLVPPADLLLTCMNADTPRLVGNAAGVHHVNSVHGVYLRSDLAPGVRRLGADLLPVAALNSLTLLAAEVVGRAYGGGLLKLEPREADRLPVPSAELLQTSRSGLEAVREAACADLTAGQLLTAVARVDAVLLTAGLGLTPSRLAALAAARAELAGRRAARSVPAPAPRRSSRTPS